MDRISRNGHEPIIDVDQVEAIEPAIRSRNPRRYRVDEISADPLSSGHTPRRWGGGIEHGDGAVVLDHDPWFEQLRLAGSLATHGTDDMG
jgi:hypothetical protein